MNSSLEDNDWFPIPGFEGYYCNSKGEIASKKRTTYKLLTVTYTDKQTIRVTSARKTSTHDVHYLVALTFHDKPSNCNYVRHLNGESWDNRPDNLQWIEEEPVYFSYRYCEKKMREAVDNFSEWKTLEHYPGYYLHSNGTIMSCHARVTIMKPILNPKPSVILTNRHGEKGMIQIAFLIATAFLPNELGYTEVIQIDRDIYNVKASNLEWNVNSATTKRNLVKEIEHEDMWKPIEPYPGYLISRQGELVSVRVKPYVLMKSVPDQKAISYRIRDVTGVEQLTIPVQKLLGLAFIPNPCKYDFIAFRNDDMCDYDLDNLYWHPNPNGCPEEGWVTVEGFPNYEVSGFGVRNKQTKLMLNPMYRQGGDYPNVVLYDPDKPHGQNIYIHLVIARNLIPNPNKYPVVNHKDGDHYNYNVNNLEWCTHSQNLQHAHDTGLRDGSTSVTMTTTGKEIWKTIDFAPRYQISNTGIVKNNKDKIMKLRSILGYHMAGLTITTGIKKYPLVHRLVASSFLNTDHLGQPLDPDIVYEVNHKNKIRSDNRVENLEIISVKHHRQKDQGKAVVVVNPITSDLKEFETITLASIFFGCSVTSISKAIREQDSMSGWFFFFRDDPTLEDKVDMVCER